MPVAIYDPVPDRQDVALAQLIEHPVQFRPLTTCSRNFLATDAGASGPFERFREESRAAEDMLACLRQMMPKELRHVAIQAATDLSGYFEADLNKVASRPNQRPRQTLGFETTAIKLQATVASTGW
jgi:hypothetical protein